MPKVGFKFTTAQRETLRLAHLGQRAWNTGTGGCKRGHDTALYTTPPSGVAICLGCKRENGAKWRLANRASHNFSNRLARYDMSLQDFTALWDRQNGSCAICSISFSAIDTSRIDHDHATGRVRGLLCVPCNTAIGLLRDSPVLMHSAARYLADAKR